MAIFQCLLFGESLDQVKRELSARAHGDYAKLQTASSVLTVWERPSFAST